MKEGIVRSVLFAVGFWATEIFVFLFVNSFYNAGVALGVVLIFIPLATGVGLSLATFDVPRYRRK